MNSGWKRLTAGMLAGLLVTAGNGRTAYVAHAEPEAPTPSQVLDLPVEILDLPADNLLFEYDQQYLRAGSLVLGNGGDYGVSRRSGEWVPIDKAGERPGDAPQHDSAGVYYTPGLVNRTLGVDGYPEYTEQAVTYVAHITANELDALADGRGGQSKTDRFRQLYSQIVRDGRAVFGDYEETVAKFQNLQLGLSDITTCMDYAYYTLHHLYDGNGEVSQNYQLYNTLRLGRTDEDTFGFYANFGTPNPDVHAGVQNYGIVYDLADKVIYNDPSTRNLGTNTEHSGLFPLDAGLLAAQTGGRATYQVDARSGNAVYYRTGRVNGGSLDGMTLEETKSTTRGTFYHNFHYALHSHGKFTYREGDNLYFSFTGDDDVYLFINGQLALDIGGAHLAVSRTVHLNDAAAELGLVEGRVYDFDFFYMERHTDYSDMLIETNIPVVDPTGQVYKKAYDSTGEELGIGVVVPCNAPITYSFELESGETGLMNLIFSDPVLGIRLAPDEVTLGTYAIGSQTQNRVLGQLTVTIDGQQQEIGTETDLKAVLARGIGAHSKIVISGIPYVVTQDIDNWVYADMDETTINSEGEQEPGRHLTSSYEHVLYTGSEVLTSAAFYSEVGTEAELELLDARELNFVAGERSLSGERFLLEPGRRHTLCFWQADNTGSAPQIRTLTLTDDAGHRFVIEGAQGICENGAEADENRIVGLEQNNAYVTYLFTLPDGLPAGYYELRVDYDTDADAGLLLLFDCLPQECQGEVSERIRLPGETTMSGSQLALTERSYANGSIPVIRYLAAVSGAESFAIHTDIWGQVMITVFNYETGDDLYVLDYGLAVSLTDTAHGNGLFQNDVLSEKLAGKAPLADFFCGFSGGEAVRGSYVPANAYTGEGDALEGSMGNTVYSVIDGAVEAVYTPTHFMDGVESFQYGMQVAEIGCGRRNSRNATPVMEAEVTVLPAAYVYYEDNFGCSGQLADGRNGILYTGEFSFQYEGEEEAQLFQENGLDTQYGYDAAYEEADADSAGSSTRMEAGAEALFCFTGTGYEVFARADTTTSNVMAQVFRAEDVTVADGTFTVAKGAKAVKSVMVNTYFENGDHRQLPVITVDGLAHGTYYVRLKVYSRTLADGMKTKFYLDGIRIHEPLGTAAETSLYRSGEAQSRLIEVREMLLAAIPFASLTEGSVVEQYDGVPYVPMNGCMIQENERYSYQVNGANHEVYLAKDNVFSFYVKPEDDAPMVQIGARAIEVENGASLYYLSKDGSWKPVDAGTDSAQMRSGSEKYYELDLQDCPKQEGVILVQLANRTEGAELIDGAGGEALAGRDLLALTKVKTAGCTFTLPPAGE